jgi:hypothetical protein
VTAKPKKKRKSPTGHVIMGGAGFRCLNCGEESNGGVAWPAPTAVVDAAGKTFEAAHAACKPDPAGAARWAYKTPEEWIRSWDTGISSLTIYATFKGHGYAPGFGAGVPHDPADFGRCYRLLKVAPEWRARLGEVADLHPQWRPLVDAWDELEALYEEEFPTGEAPKLYARIQALVDAGRCPCRDPGLTRTWTRLAAGELECPDCGRRVQPPAGAP